MRAHATLSPSSAHRWLSCPASVLASQNEPDESSVFAEEGTDAHTIAELTARLTLGLIDQDQFDKAHDEWAKGCDFDRDEMRHHAQGYADMLRELAEGLTRYTAVLEKSVDTGIPGCWGTADAMVLTPSHFHVTDFKYGRGVPVQAKGNPQMMMYGLGALETYADIYQPTEITLRIHQPRINNYSEHTMPVAELLSWKESILPIARQALQPGAPFGPSEDACRFCPLSGKCRAQADQVLAADFGNPAELTVTELAEALARVPEIKQWLTALEASSLDRVYSKGEVVPGWKVVRSGGKRVITDELAAIDRLVAVGHGREAVADLKLVTLAKLDKLVGKDNLPEVLGPLLSRSEGRPSLVPEGDARPAIDPISGAQQDFSVTD